MTFSPNPLQKFARYEFKFVVNDRLCQTLEEEISHFMRFDGFVHSELENRYVVRSLYFENMAATNFYEKIDGIPERRKFRIRTYERDFKPETPIYLEEKGRHNQRTFKNRIELTNEDFLLATDPDMRWELINKYPDFSMVKRFVFDSERRSLLPRVLVDYQRRPYVSDFDLNFRITFDSQLFAQGANTLFPIDFNPISCEAGFTIIEIKFHRRIPAWFHRLIQVYDLHRVSISKFCVGMEKCGLAVDL